MSKRNAALAGLLNVASPGLGFLYLGKPGWALALAIALPLAVALGAWSRLILVPAGFAALALALPTLWLAAVVAAARMARRMPEAPLGRLQRWEVYALFFAASLLLNNLLIAHRARLLGFETFRFPSASMRDTLLWGDFFISDTWRYPEHAPRRGELVVLRPPGDPGRRQVKRVIGLPGETIQIRAGEVRVDGARLDEPYVLPANNRGLFPGDSVARVPPESYFVLGDNRDNSYDSRMWGALPRANLHGSVEFIWLSFDWPEGLRAGRLGLRPQ